MGIRNLSSKNMIKFGECLFKVIVSPRYEVGSIRVNSYIQNMKGHVIIGKFMGIQPSKKVPIWWINSRWKPKGQVDLKLGSKDFFSIIL